MYEFLSEEFEHSNLLCAVHFPLPDDGTGKSPFGMSFREPDDEPGILRFGILFHESFDKRELVLLPKLFCTHCAFSALAVYRTRSNVVFS